MASARANIRAEISADSTRFQASMRRAQAVARATGAKIASAMGRASSSFAGLAKRILPIGSMLSGIGAALTAGAFAKGLKNAADLGGALSDVAAQTGIAAGKLAVLQKAFQDNGIEASKLGGIINKMQRAIVEAGERGGTLAEPFEALGLDLAKLAAMAPEDQFEAIQRAISSIEDPTKRAAYAMQIFGRSGGQLLTLFADKGALTNAAAALGTQAEILDRRAQDFDRISDILGGVGAKLQGFFVGMLDRIAEPVMAMLERFESIDLAGIGQRAGAAIQPFVEGLSRIVANFDMKKVIDVVAASVPVITQLLSFAIAKSLDVATALFKALFSREGLSFLYDSMIDVFVAAFNMIGEAAMALGETIAKALKGEQTFKDTTRIIGTPKPIEEGPKTFVDKLQEELGKIDFAPPDSVKDAADAFKREFDGLFPEIVKDNAKSEADLYAKELEEQRRRVAQDAATMAGPMGPSKDLMSFPVMGPPRELMNRARRFGEKGAILGGDNVFAKDRARLGIASGLTTGGLGEKRRIGRAKDEEALKRQAEAAKSSEEHLMDIKQTIGSALAVS